MSRVADETGKTYGWLRVLSAAAERQSRQVCWICRCVCGRITIVKGQHLRHGVTRSCGCLARAASRSSAAPLDLACEECRQTFRSRRIRRFCSAECRQCHRDRRSVTMEKACEACGCAFVAGGMRGRRRYCSRRCSTRAAILAYRSRQAAPVGAAEGDTWPLVRRGNDT